MSEAAPQTGFAVALPAFEGPLDLLLSLIQEHKLDVFDIPISFIIEKYLEYMDAAKALNIDLAGEYLLIELMARVLEARKLEIPHEVFVERLSIGDRIGVITDRLRAEERITFTSLFADLTAHDRHRVVPTFLAVLEMAKLKLIRVHQPDRHGEIYLSRTDALLDTGAEGVQLD